MNYGGLLEAGNIFSENVNSGCQAAGRVEGVYWGGAWNVCVHVRVCMCKHANLLVCVRARTEPPHTPPIPHPATAPLHLL